MVERRQCAPLDRGVEWYLGRDGVGTEAPQQDRRILFSYRHPGDVSLAGVPQRGRLAGDGKAQHHQELCLRHPRLSRAAERGSAGAGAASPNIALAISWRGSAGAETYDIERATSESGPWTTVATNVSDSMTSGGVYYNPFEPFNDISAVSGQAYFFRMKARNVAGDSPPSNVSVTGFAQLVDEMNDFGKMLYGQARPGRFQRVVFQWGYVSAHEVPSARRRTVCRLPASRRPRLLLGRHLLLAVRADHPFQVLHVSRRGQLHGAESARR